MGRYQVVAVWQAEEPKVPRGADLLTGVWPSGLRISLYDGRMLTVVAEVTADDAESARALVTGRTVVAWEALCGSALGAPTSCAAMPLPGVPVPAGRPGEPDKLPRRMTMLRRRPRLGDLTTPSWPEAENLGPDTWPDDDGDEGPDDGGLAGVREPRRPSPGPGHLSAAAPLPPADVA